MAYVIFETACVIRETQGRSPAGTTYSLRDGDQHGPALGVGRSEALAALLMDEVATGTCGHRVAALSMAACTPSDPGVLSREIQSVTSNGPKPDPSRMSISGRQVINCGRAQGAPAWQRAQTQSHVTLWGLADARPSERGQTQRGRCAVISASNRHPWEAGQRVSLAGRVLEGRGAAGRWAGSGSDLGAVTQMRLVGTHPRAACDRSAAEQVVLCL